MPSRPSLPGGCSGDGGHGGGGDHDDRPRPHVARHRLRSCRRFLRFILRVRNCERKRRKKHSDSSPFSGATTGDEENHASISLLRSPTYDIRIRFLFISPAVPVFEQPPSEVPSTQQGCNVTAATHDVGRATNLIPPQIDTFPLKRVSLSHRDKVGLCERERSPHA